MNNRKLLRALLIIFLLFSIILPVNKVSAATSAKIISITGDVQVLRGGGEKPFKAFVNMPLTEGDRIITGIGATAEIELDNGDAVISLSENTRIYISELRGTGDSQQTSIGLQSGSIGNSVKKALTNTSKYEIKTPTAVMCAKGTHFLVSINPATGDTALRVATGSVEGYIIPPRTPMVMPQTPITTPPPEQPGFTQPAPSPIALIPMPVPFVLNALEQISFNENDSPEQLQHLQPEPLRLVGLDLTFIELIEQFHHPQLLRLHHQHHYHHNEYHQLTAVTMIMILDLQHLQLTRWSSPQTQPTLAI